MLKKIVVCLGAVVIGIGSVNSDVVLAATVDRIQITEASQANKVDNESGADATEETENDEKAVTEVPVEVVTEETKGTENSATEETESVDEFETEEMRIMEESETGVAVEDGDPQSGTSMSNSEVEEEQPLLGSFFQNSSYTGLTYLHNSRFDTGYTIINGIDVSSHNGSVNWTAVKASGIDYVMIRAGYRTLQSGTLGEDTQFRTNIQGALNAGLKVGVYIFSQAITQAEAVAEADYVVSLVSGYNITLPLAMDYEYGANYSGRLATAGLDIDTKIAICSAFSNTVKNAGYAPMIYANKSMLQSDIRGEVLDDYYKIWLANYTTETSYAGQYYAWQYSSKGSVNGINGYVDCNFFYEQNTQSYDLVASQIFVQRLYEVLLEREGSQSEVNAYAYQISNGSASTADIALTFIGSDEYAKKGYSDNFYVQKLFQALLYRDAGKSEIEYWTERVHNGVSWRYVLAQIVGSSEYANICNKSNLPQGCIVMLENRDKNYEATAYVTRCYREFLSREPEVDGLNTWTGNLINGSSGVEIVKNMVMSDEFTAKKYSDSQVVKVMYKGMLGRAVDSDGLAYWTNILKQGVSYAYVVNGFANSDEFRQMCSSYGITAGNVTLTEYRDKNIGVSGFSTRCYEVVLERDGEADGVNYWCKNIIQKAYEPKEVMRRFVFSNESVSKNRSNSEYVDMLYQACMDRQPEVAGKQYWMNQLASGISREEVFQGFANSSEFAKIVTNYGL